jgi:hypothetical protein
MLQQTLYLSAVAAPLLNIFPKNIGINAGFPFSNPFLHGILIAQN